MSSYSTITCEECGERTRVLSTNTHDSLNIIARHRLCRNDECKKRFMTWESTDQPIEIRKTSRPRDPKDILVKQFVQFLDKVWSDIPDDQHKAELKD